jgi:hypothetical protein
VNPTKLTLQLRVLALSLSSLSLALATESGCGQSVATCADVCTADTSGSCATRCSSEQTTCDTTSGGTAQFQLLLTCIGNAAGSYTDLPSECVDAHAAVQTICTP